MSFLRRLGEKLKACFVVLLLLPKLIKESWRVASARARLDIEMGKKQREHYEQEERKKNEKR